jgi:hypothetical protein
MSLTDLPIFDSPYPRQVAEFAASLRKPCLRTAEILRLTGLSNPTLQNWVREGGIFEGVDDVKAGRSRRFTPFMLLAIDIRTKLPLAPDQKELAPETAAEIAKAIEPMLKKCQKPDAEAFYALSRVALTGAWDDHGDHFAFKLHQVHKEEGFPNIEPLLGDQPMTVWLIGRRVLDVASDARLDVGKAA